MTKRFYSSKPASKPKCPQNSSNVARKITSNIHTHRKFPRLNNGQAKQPKRLFRPSTIALNEIRRFEKSAELLIAKAPFYRLIKEIALSCKIDMRFQSSALECLQVNDQAQAAADSHFIDLNFFVVKKGSLRGISGRDV